MPFSSACSYGVSGNSDNTFPTSFIFIRLFFGKLTFPYSHIGFILSRQLIGSSSEMASSSSRTSVFRFVVVALFLILQACGGSGSSPESASPPEPDSNNAPVFTSATNAAVAENQTATGYTATATDADGDAVTFSLTGGADQAAFAISNGVLSFNNAPDFENPADADADNTYVVEITADDGNGGTTPMTVTITITNENDGVPVFTSGVSSSAAENQTATGYTATATDADGDAVTFSLTGGADQAAFAISNGVLSFNSAPDFENPADVDANNTYIVEITADDGNGGTTPMTVTITITNENEGAPVFTSATNAAVAENQTATGYTATATDADGDTVTFSLTGGADQTAFTISNGVLSFNNARDFENPADADTNNTYVVEITADDGNGGTTPMTVTITIINENDGAPIFTSGVSSSAAENQTATGYTATATDADGDAVTFSLTGGADQAAFAIGNGVLSFNSAPDFENPADADADNTYVVEITANDGNGGTTLIRVNISVTDANDAPVFTSATNASVTENQTATGYTATATDADGDTVTFSLTGGADQAAFAISNGALSFNSAPDFENPADANADNTYAVEITADDGNGGTTPITVSVSVTNANEAPVFTSGVSASIAENQTATGYTATATDADGDAVTFSLTGGADQAAFAISNGALSFNSAPDFENPADANADNTYAVEITADDGNGGTTPITVSVLVTNASQLSFTIGYPTGNAELGGSVTQTTVRGRVFDAEDGVVSDSDVVDLSVNSERALFDISDSSRWSVQVPVPEGVSQLNTVLMPASEPDISSVQNIANQVEFGLLAALALDTANNRALVSDRNALIAVDLTTGERTLISNSTTGTGPAFVGSTPRGLAFDTANNRALLVDNVNGLIAVDLTSGNRTIVSGGTTGTGPAFAGPQGLAFDAVNNRVLVLNSANSLIAVDLANGNRTLVSGGFPGSITGTGPAFGFPQGLALDAANNRALVTDGTSLIAVDLDNGDRTPVSDGTTGSGTSFLNPQALTLDAANNRALVVDRSRLALFAVDLANGDRTLISGTGPTFTSPVDVGFDGANNRALVLSGGLIAVDLTSGDRSIVSNNSTDMGFGFSFPIDVDFDAANNRALVLDRNQRALIAVDLTSGDQTIISQNFSAGTGLNFSSPQGLALDAANNRALVTDSVSGAALVAVDLTNGNRTLFSNSPANGTGAGLVFARPTNLVLDAANNRALVIDATLSALIAVDLTSGDRTLISNSTTGSGPDFFAPQGLAFDGANNRALVADGGLDALIAVDLNNGNRTIVSDDTTGTGPTFGSPQGPALDAANNRVLVTDSNLVALLAVDLTSGDRTIISDSTTGTGINFRNTTSIAYDAANNRALVTDISLRVLFVVDEPTGERALSAR